MRLLPARSAAAPALAFALVLGGCASTAPRPAAPPTVVAPVPPSAVQPRSTACQTCGRVERIESVAATTGTRPQGAVLGGVVGGVLAGPAPAKPAATAASVPRNVRLVVLLDSGRRLILTQPPVAGMKVGSRVRVDRSRAVLLR